MSYKLGYNDTLICNYLSNIPNAGFEAGALKL